MIYVIGIGSAGRASLTEAALAVIARSSLLAGAGRHLREFCDFSGETVDFSGGLSKALTRVEKASTGHGPVTVAVLATGDPGLYGIGALITKRFGKKRVRVVPNVSIVQEALSMVNERLDGLKVISAHGGGEGGERSLESAVSEILKNPRCAIYTDPENTPAKIAASLLKNSQARRRILVFEAIGTDSEKVTRGTPEEVAGREFNALNLMLVLSEEGETPAAGASAIGIPDSEFMSKGGMITKSEVRAAILSKLAPVDGSVIWDVGAGSGSVAVVTASLIPAGRVYAVEKQPVRARDIEANKAKFGATNLSVVVGQAPEALISLPTPDAVFVGGGGAGIPEILKHISKRIKKGGRVVVSAVTLDTINAVSLFFKRGKWDFEVVSVNVSRSADVGELKIMRAYNPIHIFTGIRP